MYAQQPKKMLVMNILDILRKYTDEDHRLSQKDIIEILKTEYGMTADRKAVRRNLTNLMEAGYEIEYSESIRMTPDRDTGKLVENVVTSDYYLVREFTDAELRLLIDGLLFSKHVPYAQCKELVEKLEGLSNKYFQARVKHIRTLPDRSNENKQLFYTVEVLDEAISQGRQVSFRYMSYGLDKKLHPRKDNKGGAKEYVINPYQIAAANGRYYLICNTEPYDNVANYRLDRIADPRQARQTGEGAGARCGSAQAHGGAHLYVPGRKRAGDLPLQEVPDGRRDGLVRQRRQDHRRLRRRSHRPRDSKSGSHATLGDAVRPPRHRPHNHGGTRVWITVTPRNSNGFV